MVIHKNLGRWLLSGLLALGLSACGSDVVVLDKVSSLGHTSLNNQPAIDIYFSGAQDGYANVTLSQSLIGEGKQYSQRRTGYKKQSVTVTQGEDYYTESINHDTWSRVEVIPNPEGYSVSVAGKLYSTKSGDFITLEWVTLQADKK